MGFGVHTPYARGGPGVEVTFSGSGYRVHVGGGMIDSNTSKGAASGVRCWPANFGEPRVWDVGCEV